MAPRYRDVDSCRVNSGMVWSSFWKKVVGLLLPPLSVALGFSFFFRPRLYPPPFFARNCGAPYRGPECVDLVFDNCYRRLSRLNAEAVIKFVVIETSSLQA